MRLVEPVADSPRDLGRNLIVGPICVLVSDSGGHQFTAHTAEFIHHSEAALATETAHCFDARVIEHFEVG